MSKVLLIEDSDDVRTSTSEILSLSGYEVMTAVNGKEGMELAIKEKPDIIICDITMPILDGYGVLNALSKNPETAAIPFIFLTANTQKTDRRKGMELGADDYLTKPFDDIELVSAVETRLKKAALVKASKNTDIPLPSSAEALAELTSSREVRTYKKGSVLYREGAHPRGAYYLVQGKVKTSRSHDAGKEFITGLYKDSEFFGYIALMEGKPYPESAETLDDGQVVFIPKEAFFSVLFGNENVCKKFIHLLANNVEERESQLVKLAYSSVRKRVAEALVTLCDRYKTSDKEPFAMKIRREDLASLAGTATETLIRALSDFRDDGLVKVDGRTIIITDHSRLASMAN